MRPLLLFFLVFLLLVQAMDEMRKALLEVPILSSSGGKP